MWVLIAIEENSKSYFPKLIELETVYCQYYSLKSLRGNFFNITPIKGEAIICFTYQFYFEQQIVNTNDRLKVCQPL